jgi:hypothetical protein
MITGCDADYGRRAERLPPRAFQNCFSGIEEVTRPPNKRIKELEQNLRKKLASLDQLLKELDKELSERFPAYASLTSRRPLALSDTQTLIEPDEALVTYLVGKEESYLWVVRRDRAEFFKIELSGSELAEAIQALRKSLDPKGIASLKQVPSFDTTKVIRQRPTSFTRSCLLPLKNCLRASAT